MSYVLRYTLDGQPRKFDLKGRKVLIGRAPDCDLVLTQAGISRHHCQVSLEQEGAFIEDLHSKNGTRANNIYISKTKLNPGDDILVAEFPIKFDQIEQPKRVPQAQTPPRPTSDRQVLLSDQKELHEEAGTIMRRVNGFQDIIGQYDKAPVRQQTAAERQVDSKRMMSILIEVAQSLIAVKSLDDIVKKLMDVIFEYLPADRGFLMLLNEEGHLEPRVLKHRDPNNSENIEISKTIADKALIEKMAILTTDAQVDDRFAAGESIRFLGIKSAMCVPLFHQEKTIGIIYLDSPTSAAMFGDTDLDLLMAMANFATVGIEQAQLNDKIQQETSIRQRLERYHSPSIVDRILRDISRKSKDEGLLLVQERDVTVLFADIVGFTPMSERMPPSRIAKLLNEYFSEMTEAIFKYEGTLDKYIGDAIMAIFGAPNVMPDHPYRSVCTGLEMIERLQVLNETRTPEEQFNIRIGINTGRAVAGDIGSIKRMEYTVLGNTVNVASRIESMACKPNQVVVGESTYQAVKDGFVCENIGPIRLKGISEEANVYRIISKL